MYDKFELKKVGTEDKRIIGYSWKVENPQYLICVIHGIGEHAGRYDRMAGHWNSAGFAAISMDLRGHGASFGKRGHCAPRDEILKDADDLIRYGKALYPGVPLILYGHSMGGNIVLDYRKRGTLNNAPVAFIVSAPWVELVRPVTGLMYAGVKVLSKLMPSFPIHSGVSSRDLGNARYACDYEKDPLVHDRISALCAVDGFDTGRAMAKGIHEDNGKAEGKPLLLMHGTEDRVCSINGSRKIAAAEKCDYIEWPGLFHEIHNGGAKSTGDEVIEKTIQWIQALSV